MWLPPQPSAWDERRERLLLMGRRGVGGKFEELSISSQIESDKCYLKWSVLLVVRCGESFSSRAKSIRYARVLLTSRYINCSLSLQIPAAQRSYRVSLM